MPPGDLTSRRLAEEPVTAAPPTAASPQGSAGKGSLPGQGCARPKAVRRAVLTGTPIQAERTASRRSQLILGWQEPVDFG
jgi:hypothetical protein